MKILISRHARQRMKERAIKMEDVRTALFHPDIYEPTYKNRVRIRKKSKKKTLEIVYTEEEDVAVIITCYFL